MNSNCRHTAFVASRARGDRGASLVLALAVMLAMSGIIGGLVTFVTTSDRVAVNLTLKRNRQYAADGAVEQAIRAVQTDTTMNGLLGTTCPFASGHFNPAAPINGVSIRVDCAGAAVPVLDGLNRVVLERNVVFLACVDMNVACTDATAILRAKVNFPTNAAGALIGSFVQSWSVT